MKGFAGIFLLFLVALTAEAGQNWPKGGDKCICTFEYAPVCSKKGITYGNICQMKCYGDELWHRGECQESLHYGGK